MIKDQLIRRASLVQCEISYPMSRCDEIEDMLFDYLNEGSSERDGDDVVWLVDLPSDVVAKLRERFAGDDQVVITED